jgi:periplasmic mercuric ion binding protein
MKILLMIFIFCGILNASITSIIKVEGMHCPLCTTAVKKAIKELDGIEKVSVRLNTKEVTVTYDEKTNLKAILEAIKTTSYEGVEISTSENEK